MPTPTEQLLTRTVYATDGVTTNWDFSFSGGYLDKAHIKAYTEAPTGERTDIVVSEAMVVGPYQLLITPAIASGLVLTIYRDTPKNLPLVDFTDESGFSEVALDTNAKQAVFIAAETVDTVNTSSSYDAEQAADQAATAASTAVAAQVAAQAAQVAAALSAVAADAAADAALVSESNASSSATSVFNANTTAFTRTLLAAADAAAAKATLAIVPTGTNLFINGCMRVSQRGASTAGFSTARTYGGADRWFGQHSSFASGNHTRVSSTATTSGFRHQADYVAGSAGELRLGQAIESLNTKQLQGRTFTISGKAFINGAAPAKAVTVRVFKPLSVADDYSSSTELATYTTATLANQTAGHEFSCSFTLTQAQTELGLIVAVAFPTANSEAGTVAIGDMVCEIGTIPTYPPLRPVGLELALCQRYLPAFAPANTSEFMAVGYTASTTTAVMSMPYTVTPRVRPTGITTTAPSNFQIVNSATFVANTITYSAATSSTLGVIAVNGTGITANQSCALQCNTAAARIFFTGCEIG